ncbi:1,4-alpha-glucan branching enzyme [Picrophilus oshimae DSM 9789]|uniref:1,4-alpha-glucan branching enzyme GlgB n=2 Tax=Picrophilus oshimae TaxID=46632 RepID=GLGB_PICTO|nr:RecName: Full=1,4-alpha-glucan branching enzyme GlgB; AltName: Full=1,4-alpha-D-glucan:1,4-alpha-D-glucan 6-glucosyl-transferase; AltName: Full=Alpha-(1->4)-glucan branching enzyme; AltName: Full=Glycogen branching enzyme; Short=BE [Picrophilus oshimae DSM 9789]AAT42652.1 1,4-alpha-glucan branching enzyme [Picrophilus oshimae DSM 9789]
MIKLYNTCMDFKCLNDVECSHPEKILGPHLEDAYIIRAYIPIARAAFILIDNKKYQMIDNGKVFEYRSDNEINDYKILYIDDSGYEKTIDDPYRFRPEISDYDIYLYGTGRLFEAYKTFGAHLKTIKDVSGCNFVVWAPSALSVSVVGNFNHWTPGMHPMINVNDSGIWALFIPGIKENEVYKFAIKTKNNEIKMKTDPFAFYTEKRPRTGSIVINDDFHWTDNSFKRSENALSIYEMHLGSWKRNNGDYYNYREIADMLIDHLKKTGFNCVEIMPVMEHPLDISWGYQVVNYFAPTSRYGKPDDFKYLVNRLHENNIMVILDFVPAHFPDDDYGLYMFDGTHLYDYEDPRMGRTPDWGTNIFDFGRNGVRSFIASAAVFWIDKYHVDGLRFDAVTSMIYLDFGRKPGEWIPNINGGNINLEAVSLLKEINDYIHNKYYNVITVAEESSTYPGITSESGLNFNYKWNLGWMHDTLDFFHEDPLYRKYRINNLTFSVMYMYSENFILPVSHDEVVYGKGSLYRKMPGNKNEKISNVKLFLSYMFSYPGKKLLFMGNEFAQKNEWNVLSQLSWNDLDDGKYVMELIHDLNNLYKNDFNFYNDKNFSWIDFNDKTNTVISFNRGNAVCIFNFTPVERENYAIGVDYPSRYIEIINTDSKKYNGGNILNESIYACKYPMHGRRYSIEIDLPPLAAVIMEPEDLNGSSGN